MYKDKTVVRGIWENIVSLYKRNELLCKFIFFFGMYLCLGLCLSRNNHPDTNLYFGADNWRAFNDLIIIEDVSHIRVNVHPLLLMLIQPITLLIDGMVQHKETALIIVQAVVGAVSVIAINRVLRNHLKSQYMGWLLTMIYAFSFSNMIFTSIPETFIFAGMFLVLCWSYTLYNLKANSISLKNKIIYCFLGIVCFGVTITNYFQFVLCFFSFVMMSEDKLRNKVVSFIQVITLNIVSFLGLAYVQQQAWNKSANTPIFYKQYMVLFSGTPSNFREFNYTDFSFSLEKVQAWCEQVFMRPMISGSIVQEEWGNNYYPILFQSGYALADLLILVFALVFIIAIVKGIKARKEVIGIAIALLFNYVLHFFYGAHEAFMYSPHYLFLLILIMGYGLNQVSNKMQKIINVFLTVFLFVEFLINFNVFYELIGIVTTFLGTPAYSLTKICIGVALTMLTTLCLVMFIKERIGQVVLFNKEVIKDTNDKILVVIGFYVLVIILSTVSIWLNV